MRYLSDCREVPSDMNCTVAITADRREETLEAAVQHAVSVHGHEDTQEFRKNIETLIKEVEQESPHIA